MSAATLLIRGYEAQADYDKQQTYCDRYEEFNDMLGAVFQHYVIVLLFLVVHDTAQRITDGHCAFSSTVCWP